MAAARQMGKGAHTKEGWSFEAEDFLNGKYFAPLFMVALGGSLSSDLEMLGHRWLAPSEV